MVRHFNDQYVRMMEHGVSPAITADALTNQWWDHLSDKANKNPSRKRNAGRKGVWKKIGAEYYYRDPDTGETLAPSVEDTFRTRDRNQKATRYFVEIDDEVQFAGGLREAKAFAIANIYAWHGNPGRKRNATRRRKNTHLTVGQRVKLSEKNLSEARAFDKRHGTGPFDEDEAKRWRATVVAVHSDYYDIVEDRDPTGRHLPFFDDALVAADSTTRKFPGTGYKGKTPRKRNPNPLKVGDILEASWGYDQTNVDFYQVTKVTPKMVTVRRIHSHFVGARGGPSESVMPNIGDFDKYYKPLRRRVQMYSDRPYISISSYASAYLWDGKPQRQTGALYGR